ncbi:hypothetical protein ABZ883_41810 [Streptomyces sp. NPDC046977]|uniref:hypothetical protein n=1 Tax=Streptomyces sp. NPDC046977 TaxID=3154703 RepID=UPI0033C72C08
MAGVVAGLSGCGALADRKVAATAAAAAFEDALRTGDSNAACAALAPATRLNLEQSAKAGCVRGLSAQDLTSATGVRAVDVFGQQARVVFASDTVFLSRFSSGWKVTAAGCSARPERPYDCEIKGG